MVNTERDYVLEMWFLCIKSSEEDEVYAEILNGTFNLNWRWIFVNIILNRLAKFACCHHPEVVITVKRVIGGQYSQVVQRVSIKNNHALN